MDMSYVSEHFVKTFQVSKGLVGARPQVLLHTDSLRHNLPQEEDPSRAPPVNQALSSAVALAL